MGFKTSFQNHGDVGHEVGSDFFVVTFFDANLAVTDRSDDYPIPISVKRRGSGGVTSGTKLVMEKTICEFGKQRQSGIRLIHA